MKQRKNILLEDKEGKNLAKARHYLVSKGYNSNDAQQLLNNIRTDIPNTRMAQCKFILGTVRLYLQGQLSDGHSIHELNNALKYIASDAHVNEYDNNLNDESLQVLVNRFKGVAKDDLRQSMAASNARQLTVNQDYTIVPINNFEESSKYGKYTSWCVTHYENMFNSYTAGGSGRFYFCLRNGFEEEPEVKGEGCPLDRYGLSMIAVSVDMEGAVNTITCRWNHDMGGNDSIMTIEELETLLGRNFYQTFKPYTREELHAKGVIMFDEVQSLLDSGKKPEDIFDYVSDFWKEDVTRVNLNRKYNFINTEGKIISDTWFDYASDFKDGFARVKLNEKFNLINTEGKIISDTWFDTVYNFSEGFAVIELNRKYNFINTEGNLLSDTWFDDVSGFKGGFARVKLNGNWNFINKRGKIVESKNRNGKTIIITEEQKKKLTESILSDTPSDDVINAIFRNKTSLQNTSSFSKIGNDFLEMIIKKRYKEIKNSLEKIGTIDDFDVSDAKTMLAKLILKCQKIEKLHRNELEKLGFNYVVNFFKIPEDTITMDLKLVDKVDIDTSVINIDPVVDGDFSYEDLNSLDDMNEEIYKRRLLDILSIGFGMQISNDIKSYLSDIFDVDPRLPDLYRKILLLNEYLLFTTEDLGITDKSPMQMGNVILNLGQENETVVLKAQGMIFPVLLAETMRGLMELFSAHGLPKNKEKVDLILGKSDYLKAEPWDMRIGPSLWTIVSDSFENVDSELLPYLYKRIAMLKPKVFISTMQEVFAKTRKGKKLMGSLVAKAKNDADYDKFSDKMTSLQTDKNLINDEYINENEL